MLVQKIIFFICFIKQLFKKDMNPNNQVFSQRRIETVNELPIEHKNRRITDICCCGCGVIFGLILFILALVLINRTNIARSNFPTDNQGHICLYDQNAAGQTLPFLYFNDPANPMQSRMCVSDCPQPGVNPQCWNGTCSINYYPTDPQSDKLGSYCMPQDATMKQKLVQDTGINLQSDALTAITVLLISFGISIGISILWLILVHYCPKVMVWVAFILAILLLIATAIIFFVDAGSTLASATGWAIFLGLLALVIALIIIAYIIMHRNKIQYCGVFLQNASLMIREKCVMTLLYIPLFMLFTILFCILIVFEYLSFSSVASPVQESGSLYLKLVRSFWFMAPLVIQTLWGLSFFRDAFNFCVSGLAIQWYFRKPFDCCYPLKAFFLKHFGSVAGGSFLTAFLYIPNLFIDLCCNNKNALLCNCLDLPRNDAYPYIFMTGTSFCPAVRQVQYICTRSKICQGNESTNTFYALCARLVIALLTTLIAYIIMVTKFTITIVNAYVLLGVFFMALFVTYGFVDLHVDVAEALMVAFLAEYDVDQTGYKDMHIARDTLKNAIDDLAHNNSENDEHKRSIFKH